MKQASLNRSRERIMHNRNNILLFFVYSFILLFFCSMSSPLYPINTWCDVNIYFNIGKSAFNGHTLYSESFDHKGPIIFFIYGIAYLISNSSFLGVFIIEVIAWTIMLTAVFLSAKLFVNRNSAIAIVLLFPLLLFYYTDRGGSAEEFILVLQSVGLYLFLKYMKEESLDHPPAYMFMHGVLSSIVFFIKLNLIVFWFFPLLYIFINLLLRKNIFGFFKNSIAYLGGFLLISLLVISYFVYNDSLDKAYAVYIVLNSGYASIPSSLSEILLLLLNRIYQLFRDNPLAFVILFTGIFAFPYKCFQNRFKQAVFVLWGLSVFLIVSVTRSFFNYYNIPLCIFLMSGLVLMFVYIEDYLYAKKSRQLVKLLFAICLLYGINLKVFFNTGGEVLLNKEKATGVIYDFGEIIKKEKDPVLLNLGFGDGNAIFTYCNIVPSLTYSMTPNVPYELYPELRDEQTKYIENKEATFIILTNVSMNYEYFNKLPALIDNYEQVAVSVDEDSYFKNIKEFYIYYLYKKK